MRKTIFLLGVLIAVILLLLVINKANGPDPVTGANFLSDGPTPTSWLPYATDLPPVKATLAVGEIQTQQAGFNLPTLDPQEQFPNPKEMLVPDVILSLKPKGKIAGSGIITTLPSPNSPHKKPYYVCQQDGWVRHELEDYTMVWACVEKDDPAQSTMVLVIDGLGKYNPLEVTVKSPVRAGLLQIVDAIDSHLVLQPNQGQQLYFDVDAQVFVQSPDQSAPTVTPVPTRTIAPLLGGTDDGRDIPNAVYDFAPADSDLSYYINSPTDVDWFRFQVLKPGSIKVTLRQLPGSYGMYLFRLDGQYTATKVGEDLARGKGNKLITLKDAEAGEYMVRVVSLDGSFSESQPYVLRFEPPPLEKLVPILKCVSENSNGTLNAYWGYQNPNPMVVAIEPGSKDNRFQPKPKLRIGQPGQFIPGMVDEWFGIQFDGNELHWELDGNIAKADRNSPRCP
jgi:hypothetical protein